ncbi:MAG: GAF domain-containing protein [Cytophagales bacterium]
MIFSKNSIVTKLITGYAVIILLCLILVTFGIYVLDRAQKTDESMIQENIPNLLLVKDFSSLLSEAYKLTNNWAKQQANIQEKERLKDILEKELPNLKNLWLSQKENSTSFIQKVDSTSFFQQKIMELLKNDDSFDDDEIVDQALEVLKNDIEPLQKSLISVLTAEEQKQKEALLRKSEEKQFFSTLMQWFFIGIIIAFSTIAGLASIYCIRKISRPLKLLTNFTDVLAQGVLPEKIEIKQNDEIGKMSKAIMKVADGVLTKSAFAESIGKGKFDFEFQMLSENDILGKSLLQMRENLQINSIEDKRRNWTSAGLSNLADILRNLNQSEQEIFDNSLRFLVKYSHSNQGALFLLSESDENKLEMVACYAYERKKFINKEILVGEGLVGQIFLEGELTYLSEIPENYMNIRSGIGEASPRSLVLIPLIYNEKKLGVLELASFTVFEQFELEFLQKASDSIASTISSARINSRTKKLLEESQLLSEQMRNQEEELRQNLEELLATQEESNRRIQQFETLLQEKESIIKNLSVS